MLGTTVLVEAKGVTFENALIVLVLANAVGFIGYVFHGWLGDRSTRKRTVVIGWLAGGIAGSGVLSLLLFLEVDMQWAAIVSGTGGLLVSALCMAGTRPLEDAHLKTTVIA